MTGTHYLILAYSVAIGLLWGYALHLWRLSATLGRRESRGEQL